jgi:sigma-B regulation protein RsbU (phosphoserine phosphatase)
MATSTALLVGEPSRTRQELGNALRLTGFEVRQAAPEETIGPPDPAPKPDMLLVSAALGLQRVAVLSERFATEGHPPTTVVYPEGDIAALESCVLGGFDYVMPPFAPGLLRTRLTTCRERGRLTMTVEEMANAASLHSYERELSIAREIQSGFLPEELPAPEDWQVAARFRPARMVAGDFYDVFELAGGRRLALVVGDVCDKGIGAALFMALIRTMLRHTAEQAGGWNLLGSHLPRAMIRRPAPARRMAGAALAPSLSVAAGPLLEAVSGTNSYMARHHQRQAYFCTLFFGILDPASGALLYINGGHNPPILLTAEGRHSLLQPTGPAVGMFASSSYLLEHVTLQPGDKLFMYTDGVTEARDADGGFFGLDRTLEAVSRPAGSAEEMLAAVDGAVRGFTGTTEQFDDITMLALHRPAR